MKGIKLMLSLIVALVSIIWTTPKSNSSVLAAAGEINIVALGDSYTAGNGALDYEDMECWRSANAYIHQYAEMVRNSTNRVVTSDNFACASKETEHIAGQIVEAGDKLSNAEIVVMTIGGNDAQFVEIAKYCIVLRLTDPCISYIDQAMVLMDVVINNTRQALELIHTANPNALIALVGYPYLAEAGCHTHYDYVRNLQSAWSGRVEAMTIEYDAPPMADRLSFVSTADAFVGGGFCGQGQNLIRGFLDTLFPDEWLHPNREGHTVIANELMKLGLHSRFASSPQPAPVYTPPPPATGTPTYSNLPFDCGTVVPYVSTYDVYGGVVHGYALDMPMPTGTRLVAPDSGTTYVHNDPHGYGIFIDLVAEGGLVHRFAHLSVAEVEHGQQVARGELIGKIGSTGFSTGPHLHYEQRVGSSQIEIDLDGPALQWSGSLDSSGFKATTHALLSGNCYGETGSVVEPYADIITHEWDNLRYGRSNGHNYSNWEIGLPTIQKPYSSVVCDFDGDGWDEFLSYERYPQAPASPVMMADPHGDGSFEWKHIATLASNVNTITCGDWDNDGRDDLIYHSGNFEIVVGTSNGQFVGLQSVVLTGIGVPSYWDVCDINGDGQQNIVSYEGWANQLMVGSPKPHTYAQADWRYLLSGIYGVYGMTCDNFQSHSGDELVVWQPEHNGHYRIGVFTSSYSLLHWEILSPMGLGRPHNGEVVSGDIDGDGYAEFVVNEYREQRGDHSVMVGDFTSPRGHQITWHAFIEGVTPSNLGVGRFIG